MRARYRTLCHNCERHIERGDDIRTDFDNRTEKWRAVHCDCTDLKDIEDTQTDFGEWTRTL